MVLISNNGLCTKLAGKPDIGSRIPESRENWRYVLKPTRKPFPKLTISRPHPNCKGWWATIVYAYIDPATHDLITGRETIEVEQSQFAFWPQLIASTNF